MRIGRSISALCPCLLLLVVAGCGSSATTTTTGPTASLTRCSVTASGTGNLPAEGGTGTITVSAERECGWTASVDGQWLSIKSGSSGQGEGKVEFMAASNPDPMTRNGAVVLNDKRVAVIQAAGVCVITLAERGMSFGQEGGAGRVEVRASSQLCTWTAESDASWIVLQSEVTGKGTAEVSFTVRPAAGQPRSGAIRIAGQTFTVTQSAGCTFDISPSSHRAAAAGGSGSIAVATAPGCTWTATTSVSWLTLSTAAGEGPGEVSFTVAANVGAERSGTATIAGQTFTVTQDRAATPPPPSPPPPTPPPPGPTPPPACSFTVSPASAAVPAAGGSGTIAVTAAAGCAWQAVSQATWIQIVSGSTGSGNGQVVYAVTLSTGAARVGTVTIAGQTFTVNQAAAPVPVPTPTCTFTVKPLTLEVSEGERSDKLQVETAAGCAWTATSNASWIKIQSGATGSGTGEVALLIEENKAAQQRVGTLTVAGQTVTITQKRK